jgi:uncharacterized protein YaaW (UPF0174 family)
MKEILKKCKKEDFKYLSIVLDSYLSFTNDRKRQRLLNNINCSASRKALIELLDRQIRYYGSSDLAYFKRFMLLEKEGVPASVLIEDVCKKLKIRIRKGGSVQARLERVVNAIVEKELLSRTPKELSKAFDEIGVGQVDKDLIMEGIKTNGKFAMLPILTQIIGIEETISISEAIIVAMIAQIIGKEAAKGLIKEILKKNPWLQSLGPVVWSLSIAWIAFDLQRPAFRKTVPVVLYLGIVAMRKDVE